MASAAYNRWDREGRPFELATPIQEIQAWAEANDVPVLGTIGNDEHLEAVPPQDHTPFSATFWPVPLDGWIVTAIDLKNVSRNGVTLGYAIEGQARAGLLPWLKYMNHAHRHLDVRDLDGDGTNWEVYPSSDEHVHLSINTLWQHRSIGPFNPWGTGVKDKMLFFCENKADGTGKVWISDGTLRRHVKSPAETQRIMVMAAQGWINLAKNGAVHNIDDLDACGVDVATLQGGAGGPAPDVSAAVRAELNKTRLAPL